MWTPTRALATLDHEIQAQLGRPADVGDLILLVASVPGGLAARALAGAGVDTATLAAADEAARRSGERSALLPDAELVAGAEEAREDKEAAIDAQEFERAAICLRDRERALRQEAREAVDASRQEGVLAEVRAHLGLTER